MKAIATALMFWISSQTGLPVPELPTIQMVSADSINEQSNRELKVLAYYHKETETIWLPHRRFDIGWTSLLVHELTHHMQFKSSRKYNCVGEMEKEAYSVQKVFLELDGRTLEQATNIGSGLLLALTSCSGRMNR
jgi:hypothetical protein